MNTALFSLLKGDYMNILYGIIIGIVADKIILPILDNLNDLIGLWFEEKRTRISYQINSLHEQSNEQCEEKRIIGFRNGDE